MSRETRGNTARRFAVCRCVVIYELTAESLLERPLPAVFAFFADARTLEAITPPWLHFEVLSPAPTRMAPGVLIDYRLRLRGVPLSWRSEITAWEPPFRFVDEQRKGPYRLWVHEHTFETRGAATVAVDRVWYAAPGGALVNLLFVAADLERIFAFRQRTMTGKFGGRFTPVKIRRLGPGDSQGL